MHGILWLMLTLLAPAGAEEPVAAPRRSAEVVAIHDDLAVLDLGDESGVGPGSILSVYRRLPGARGSADYRRAALWWAVGRVRVIQVDGGGAVATWSGPPDVPLPAGLDESGARADRVHIGDRARSTGAVGERPRPVRVTFARGDLFAPQDAHLGEAGGSALKSWLAGLRSMEGPIRIEVHVRLEELGVEAPDLDRLMSSDRDAPFGPSPGSPTVPADRLYGAPPSDSTPPPPGREIMIVESAEGGPERWHYLDPLSLAWQQGQDVAAALAARLGVDPALVAVTVVPRGTWAEGEAMDGYDPPGDQVRILAAGITWKEPPPPAPRKPEVKPKDEPPPRRRLLERLPDELSGRSAPAQPQG